MKATILLITLVLFARSVNAQCDVQRETDEFNGKTTVYSSSIKLLKGGASPLAKSFGRWSSTKCYYRENLYFIYVNDTIYLRLVEESDFCRCMVQSIEIKFSDGKVITKTNVSEGEMNRSNSNLSLTFFVLTKEDLAEFAASEIAKIRFTEGDCSDHPIIQQDIDDKVAKKIKESASCFQQEYFK